MKKQLTFRLNGKKVEITPNAVKCKDLSIAQELINLFIQVRASIDFSEDPVMRLFNDYIRFMDVSDIQLTNITENRYIVPQYILEEEMMMDELAA
jgi:hypothetical protein